MQVHECDSYNCCHQKSRPKGTYEIGDLQLPFLAFSTQYVACLRVRGELLPAPLAYAWLKHLLFGLFGISGQVSLARI
jgi:hypothetical protein